MVFVFEARRLPFSSITEEHYEASKAALLEAAGMTSAVSQHLNSLPLWDRCMLMAVLSVVLDGRRQQQKRLQAAGDENGVACTEEIARDAAAGGDANASDKVERKPREGNAPPQHFPPTVTLIDVDDVVLSLKMVKALDELEVSWDHIKAVRSSSSGGLGDRADRGCLATSDLAGERGRVGGKRRAEPELTDEEVMMDLLLAERGVPGFLRDSESAASSDEGELHDDGDEAIDIAMCFDGQGESIGMGSSGVYGGHGFHFP